MMKLLLRKVMKLITHQDGHIVACPTPQLTSSPLRSSQLLEWVSTREQLGGKPLSFVCKPETKRK
jgi:hypothetical protein